MITTITTWRARGAALLLALFVVAAVGAGLMPYAPEQVRTAAGIEALRAPSGTHWLGTDDRGRDVASRLAHGARTSLALAAAVLALSTLLGAAAGAAAGSTRPRGPVDALVIGGCDVISAVPSWILVVAAQGLVGRASLVTLALWIAVPRAADVARVTRAEVRRALAAPFAEAARAAGAGRLRLALRHGLPHAAPQLLVAGAGTLSFAVLAEAALGFVGLGVPAPTASWGELLRQAQAAPTAWWLALPAAAAVALVAIAANALADEAAAGVK